VLLRGFCRDVFEGFFFESILGVDGPAVSFDREAVCAAFGFGAAAGGGAEAVEAGAGAAVAIDAASGLTVCGTPDEAAGFGVSVGGGVEAVEAGVGGAAAIGVPSGLMIWEATGMAPRFGWGGVNAGGADSKPEEAGCGGSASAFSPTESGPLLAGAVLASGRVSKAPACKGAACPPSSSERELEGLRTCSFCVPANLSVAVMEGSRSGAFGALLISAKLAQTAATPASASPPAVSFQRRELVDS
jgi:hypothetical protein